MPANFTSPAGRLVQGDAYRPNDKDSNGAPLTDKNGAPRVEYHIAIAIQKDSAEWPAFKALLDAESAAAWPQGQWKSPSFSSKIEDGDSTIPNKKGIVPNTRPGFPGCWVVHFTNGFAPSVWSRSKMLPPERQGPEPEAFIQLYQDSGLPKKGNVVRVSGDTKGNSNQQSPGMYMNFNMLEFLGYHPDGEIVSANQPSPSEAFGAAPVGAPVPTVAAPAASAPAPAPTASPSEAPAPEPYTGYAEVPAPGPVMTPKANGVTYEAFIAKGWTDEQLKAQGYMA